MITVKSDIKIYEADGQIIDLNYPTLTIQSHRNDDRRVVIELPHGGTLTVIAADLIAAIKNATNTNRF